MSEFDRLQFTADLNICRILNGMWQVSGAHGPIAPTKAIETMFHYTDAGLTTWDLADHYGPAEDFIGEFRRQLLARRGKEALENLQAFTKWVPRPGKMTLEIVEKNIDISLRRMDVDSLDLLQFHWWDYRDKNYLDALYNLTELQKKGKVKHLALTNFDTDHLKIITGAGIKIVSNQVQFSLIDRRPLLKMVDFCKEHNIYLLAYGTVTGGLFSAKYLNHPEPGFMSLNTASLRKYKNMIDTWGGWKLFQQLLAVLKPIADRYQVTMPIVAVRYILEQPRVAGAIVGTRLGVSEHIAETKKVFDFQLSPEDHQTINSVLDRSHDLFAVIGDCGDEYRK
jgi:aryl-alcohol dehydrogenase-like predicted oxidoreductase